MRSPAVPRLASPARSGVNMFNRYLWVLPTAALAASSANGSNSPRAAQAAIAARIKADVAEIIAGINSKDINQATKFDAPDLISMESMRPPSIGAKADRDGLSMAFKSTPSWHLSLVEEAVDVAKAGDMAIYRSTYNEDSMRRRAVHAHRQLCCRVQARSGRHLASSLVRRRLAGAFAQEIDESSSGPPPGNPQTDLRGSSLEPARFAFAKGSGMA
jgi:ketosteroid isomerase-like protein